MTRWLVSFVVLTIVLGGLFLFAFTSQRESLLVARREASLCLQERASLRSRVIDLERALARTETSAEAGEQEHPTILAGYDELVGMLEEQAAGGKLSVAAIHHDLVIDMDGDLLFAVDRPPTAPEPAVPSTDDTPSPRRVDGAVLSEAGVELLLRIGQVVQRYELQRLVVQGYTSVGDLAGPPAGEYSDRLEITAARAAAVVCFLQEQVGIDASRLAAVAHAEHGPGEDAGDAPAVESGSTVGRIELVLSLPAEPEERVQGDSTHEQPADS